MNNETILLKIAMQRQFNVVALWLTSQLAEGRNSAEQKVIVSAITLTVLLLCPSAVNQWVFNDLSCDHDALLNMYIVTFAHDLPYYN